MIDEGGRRVLSNQYSKFARLADPGLTRGFTHMGFHKVEGEIVHRRFQMRKKLFSIGEDYWIEDDQGRRAYRVDGKKIHVRDTWILDDAGGNEVAKIQERRLSVRDKMAIELADGREATVKKALIGFRDRFKVEIDDEPDIKVHGDIIDHDYEIERDGERIANISKKWFRLRDTYGVEVIGDVSVPLILSIAVAVETMTSEDGPDDGDEKG